MAPKHATQMTTLQPLRLRKKSTAATHVAKSRTRLADMRQWVQDAAAQYAVQDLRVNFNARRLATVRSGECSTGPRSPLDRSRREPAGRANCRDRALAAPPPPKCFGMRRDGNAIGASVGAAARLSNDRPAAADAIRSKKLLRSVPHRCGAQPPAQTPGAVHQSSAPGAESGGKARRCPVRPERVRLPVQRPPTPTAARSSAVRQDTSRSCRR